MTIKEVYNKYKHLDKVIMDREWCIMDIKSSILFDLWQTIKEANKCLVRK